MKHIKRWATATLMVASLGFVSAVGTEIASEPDPAAAHHTCSVSRVRGGPTWTKTYNGQQTSNNCRVQARLKRHKYGGAYNLYGPWGMLTSYRYSTWGVQWLGGGRNCGRLHIPSSGYTSPWYCN